MLDNVILYVSLAIGIILLVVGCLSYGSRKLKAAQEAKANGAQGQQYQPMSGKIEDKFEDEP